MSGSSGQAPHLRWLLAMNRKLIWAGLVVLAAGVLAGFLPVRSHGTGCGSAFNASSDAGSADLDAAIRRDRAGLPPGESTGEVAESCDSLRSLVRIPAIVLVAVGGGLAAGAWVLDTRRAVRAEGGAMFLGRPVRPRPDDDPEK